MLNKICIFGTFSILMHCAPKLFAQKTPSSTTYSSSKPRNYVRVWDVLAPVNDPSQVMTRPAEDVRMSTSYSDGLGRPLQTVVREGSLETSTGTKNDIVTNMEYDSYGRDVYKNMPFPYPSNTGGFKLDAFPQQLTVLNGIFSGQGESGFYYGQSILENSPLGRPEKQMSQGTSWVGNAVGVQLIYWMNTAADDVKFWTVSNPVDSWGTYSISSTTPVYPEGSLIKTLTIDERGNQVVEFKDRAGQVILKKVQISTSAGVADDGSGRGYSGWLSAYYIYDDFGNLRCVIQPAGVELLASNGWNLTTAILDEQCFRYEYDERNRMVMKKVPGAGEVWMVYDTKDRLVLTQDQNNRNTKWLYTQYDTLNRPVSTGLWNNTQNRTTHKASAYNSTTYPSLNGQTYEILTNTFYDNYDWVATNGNPVGNSYDPAFDSHLQSNDNPSWPYHRKNSESKHIRGQVTGTSTKVLGSNTYLFSANFYDEKGRVIQTQSKNYTNRTDVAVTQYGWSGVPLISVAKTTKATPNEQTMVVVTKMNYDVMNRVISLEKKISHSLVNGGSYTSFKPIVSQEYDKLGQVKIKYIGGTSSTYLEKQTYEYNVRGWLLGVNRAYARDDASEYQYFGFDLGYDKISNQLVGGKSYIAAQLNGNISGMVWKSRGDGEKRKYDFTYDAANRLLKADFTQYTEANFNTVAGIDFSMFMGANGLDYSSAYDANGNILRMQQMGRKPLASAPIDDLQYEYLPGSNKLKKVTDAFNDPNSKLGDFKYSTKGSYDYTYDGNGNMISDANKSISAIEYNYLNLPSVITVTGKGTISYVYDAAGNKIQKTVTETGQPTKTTLYLSGVVYENDVMQFTGHEEGRIRFSPAAGALPNTLYYDYMMKDHLGNVRMVLTEEVQTKSYPVASMEPAEESIESQYYFNINSTIRSAKPAGYPNDTYTNPNDYVAKLNGQSGATKIGPAIILKVMSGDKFTMRVNSWWKSAGGSPSAPNPLTELANALANGVAGAAGGKVTGTDLLNSGLTGTAASSFLGTQTGAATDKPQAFVNWVLLDENFNIAKDSAGNFIRSGYSGFDQVGADQVFTTHSKVNEPINKNGYLYIYVSNQTPNMDVYFDNLQVTHIKGPILEETHYYPFGLTMAGISSKALNGAVENKRKFNGIEQNTDFDLNMYDAFYRNLDPQIGRFWQVDPYANELVKYSPYESMGNNPVKNIDPLGDFKTWFGAFLHKIFNGGGEVGKNKFGEWFVRKTAISYSEEGGPTVTARVTYGEGRNRSMAKRERLVEELNEQKVIDDLTRVGIWDPNLSEVEARNNTLSLGVNLAFPSALIKPATIAINVEKVASKIKIIFGNNPNQVYHAFRHIEEMGLSRQVVQKAIEEHLPTVASEIVSGEPLNKVIEVSGKAIQYTAYKLADGTINVGRITGIK